MKYSTKSFLSSLVVSSVSVKENPDRKKSSLNTLKSKISILTIISITVAVLNSARNDYTAPLTTYYVFTNFCNVIGV